MVYHIFNYRIQNIWYRDQYTCSDTQFDLIMGQLDWKMPVNMQAYHYGSPGPEYYAMNNSVILRRPTLSLDPYTLTAGRVTSPVMLYDKQKKTRFPVYSRQGRFVLCKDLSSWPRFYYVDGDQSRLTVATHVIPISFAEARIFVDHNHRHNVAPQGHKFSIGLAADGEDGYIGVAIASIPKARYLNDGLTLEINRVCCDPIYDNACSKLYSAAIAAGKAMGYRRFVTYSLPGESGSSIKAVGFRYTGNTANAPEGWDRRERPRAAPTRYPKGPKCRWMLVVL